MPVKIHLNEQVGGYKYLKSVGTGWKFVNFKNFKNFWENLEGFEKILENLKKIFEKI